jgi:LmbE family N-acetylglucosaminyl deacetylase
MRKTIVCVFAHPDDEAFGPGGSIATFAKDNDVYVICVTNGDAGKNSSGKNNDLGKMRRTELRNSAKILRVKQVFFLGYKDGYLCNSIYHEVAEKVKKKLKQLKPHTLLTYEHRGISGHIDHIFVSMVTSFVFEEMLQIKEIYYYCMSETSRAKQEKYFIYFPPGYKKSEIDKTIKTNDVWETKVKAMHAHKSQLHDIDRILKSQSELPKEEHFIVKSR